jgi:hypothetical protein
VYVVFFYHETMFGCKRFESHSHAPAEWREIFAEAQVPYACGAYGRAASIRTYRVKHIPKLISLK